MDPVLPRYDGGSILNVPASVCAALGAPAAVTAPALDAGVLPRATSDPARIVRLDREQGLIDELRAPPTGERRMVHLHARPGRPGAVRAYCAERLATVAECIEPAEALGQGLCGPGPISDATRRRVGDLLLLAREDYQLAYPFVPRREPTAFAGNHGGLDRREMLVPLIAVRL